MKGSEPVSVGSQCGDSESLLGLALDTQGSRPGALQGRIILRVHSFEAERLVRGRRLSEKKPSIIGLLGFANLVHPIWRAAMANDPYADWWLLKVDEALGLALNALAEKCEDLEQRLNETDALSIDVAHSVKPVQIPLDFADPYAFRATRIITAYDRLIRIALTARFVGLLTRLEAEETVNQGGNVTRRAFTSPLGFRDTGVTRRDVAQGSEQAKKAQTLMGELPLDVFDGTRRAPYAPAVPLLGNLERPTEPSAG